MRDQLVLVRRLLVDPRVRWRHRLALWGLLAYLVNPIDLVPDFIPVLGLLDDVLIAALVLRWLRRSLEADGMADDVARRGAV
jgi:uncharacterized membrane protein YkvA (DUF1232 family)